MNWPDVDFLWHALQRCQLPVVLYGMGDGADKALAVCREYGIAVQGVFASPEFVRGQTFRGFPVRTLEETEAVLGDFVVLLCFATQRPEVMARIRDVAARHKLYAPDLPVCGGGILTPQILKKCTGDIELFHDLLADSFSRKVLRDLVAYKLSGDPAYLWACETPPGEAYTTLLRPGSHEFYVDAGAYTGDTVDEFLQHTGGRYSHILALEPDRRNFNKLCQRVDRLTGGKDATCLQTAVWSHKDTLPFSHSSGRQSAVKGAANQTTPADSIDNLLAGKAATLINFDVEGAEREALLGCTNTIRRHKPKLAVSIYHHCLDFFQLPLLIHQLNPAYKLHLRHHNYLPAWDTLCYAL